MVHFGDFAVVPPAGAERQLPLKADGCDLGIPSPFNGYQWPLGDGRVLADPVE